MREYPKLGSKWIHIKSNNVYRVLFMANVAFHRIGHPPTVVYEDEENQIWTRDFSEWHEKFVEDRNGSG